MYHGFFYQAAHRHGTNPTSPDPAFRLLRFILHDKTYDKALEFIQSKMDKEQGDVLFVTRGVPILIRDHESPLEGYKERIKEIEDAHRADIIERENEFHKRRQLMLNGQRDEANAVETKQRERHNAKGWIKYCKEVYNVDQEVIEGAEIERPVMDDEFEEHIEQQPPSLPAGVLSKRDMWAAVSWIVANDDTMDTVLYVHDVFTDDDDDIEDKVKYIHTDQLPVDVIKIGEWIRPVHCMWYNTPKERTWGDKTINEFQDGRRAYKRETRIKQREMQLNQAKRQATVLRLTEASGLSRDQVDEITKEQEGMNALHHALSLSDSVLREEELERVCAKFTKT